MDDRHPANGDQVVLTSINGGQAEVYLTATEWSGSGPGGASAELFGPSGELSCWVDGGTLFDVAGNPLFEVIDGDVYAAGAEVPRFTFSGDRMFAGSGRTATALLALSSATALASDVRRLELAALVDGYCGVAQTQTCCGATCYCKVEL